MARKKYFKLLSFLLSLLITSIFIELYVVLFSAVIATTADAVIAIMLTGTKLILAFSFQALQHLGNISFNLGEAWLSPSNSVDRKNYLQDGIKQILSLFITASIIIAVEVETAFFPIMITVAAIIIVNFIWELSPSFRQSVKHFLHLNKPEQDMVIELSQPLKPLLDTRTEIDKHFEAKYQPSLFISAYRKEVIVHYMKAGKVNSALNYLKEEIDKKLKQFSNPNPASRQEAKKQVLQHAAAILESEDGHASDIDEIITASTQIHQSFFAITADTIDLLEAIRTYLQYVPTVKVSFHSMVPTLSMQP